MSFFKKLFKRKEETTKEEVQSVQENYNESDANHKLEEAKATEAARAEEEAKAAELAAKAEEEAKAAEAARAARAARAEEEAKAAELAAKAEEEAKAAEAAAKAEEEAKAAEAVAKAETEAKVVEATEEVVEATEEVAPKKKGFFSKLINGLTKTRDQFLGAVDDVLSNFKKIDEDLYEELEEALIMADFGVETTMNIMEKLRKKVKEEKIIEPNDLKKALQDIITGILTAHEWKPLIEEGKPNVILVIGVNGVGKTTTIGKLAHQFKEENKNVILAAADTFRAAAIEQLQIWADRSGVPLIKHEEGSDPASVVFDGIKAAKARKCDLLICDTAGRLQNKANLMKELEKMGRIIEREYPEAHKEVLIVLDATTGQNAISQVKVFKEVANVDGIILTKLDGTAKGGAVVGICENLNVPVKYIGVGEKIDDLQPFDPAAFAAALFER